MNNNNNERNNNERNNNERNNNEITYPTSRFAHIVLPNKTREKLIKGKTFKHHNGRKTKMYNRVNPTIRDIGSFLMHHLNNSDIFGRKDFYYSMNRNQIILTNKKGTNDSSIYYDIIIDIDNFCFIEKHNIRSEEELFIPVELQNKVRDLIKEASKVKTFNEIKKSMNKEYRRVAGKKTFSKSDFAQRLPENVVEYEILKYLGGKRTRKHYKRKSRKHMYKKN